MSLFTVRKRSPSCQYIRFPQVKNSLHEFSKLVDSDTMSSVNSLDSFGSVNSVISMDSVSFLGSVSSFLCSCFVSLYIIQFTLSYMMSSEILKSLDFTESGHCWNILYTILNRQLCFIMGLNDTNQFLGMNRPETHTRRTDETVSR
jgi:hypothetical protein